MATPEDPGEIALADGRTLAYVELGAREGPAVVVLDGPGSRGLARAAAPAAAQLGLRLIAPDRPGFLGSSPKRRGTIAGWPDDLAQLADALELPTFGILAQSGGTPYALAAAARLPQRVRAIALAGAVAPLDEPGAIDDVRGPMHTVMLLALRAPWLLRPLLTVPWRQARRNPARAAARVLDDLPPRDAEVMEDPAMRALHVRTTEEILRHPAQTAYEMRLLARPWGIDLAEIRTPAALWVGAHDTTHPPAMSQRIADRLPDATLTVVPDAATFGLRPVYPEILRFASGRKPATVRARRA
jgi:pimeloyl-ACP methyl ester carboxylesterase